MNTRQKEDISSQSHVPYVVNILSIRHTKLVEIVTLKKGALFARTSAIAGLSSLQCGTRNILSTNIAGMLNTGFKLKLSIPDFIFQ